VKPPANFRAQRLTMVAARARADRPFMVGAGILISRIIGVIRQRVFAHYLGTSDAAGAFSAAFSHSQFSAECLWRRRAVSVVHSRLRKSAAKGDKEEASRVADAVLTLLALATSLIVLVGVLTTPFFVGLFAASFDPATRELTIQLIRIFFPGAGLLVLSAWCWACSIATASSFSPTPRRWFGTFRSSRRSFGSAGATTFISRPLPPGAQSWAARCSSGADADGHHAAAPAASGF
jgi:hypothetical protein